MSKLSLSVVLLAGCGFSAVDAPDSTGEPAGEPFAVAGPTAAQPGPQGELEPLVFSRFGPGQGLPGVAVKFLGHGFSEVPEENVVTFGGAVAKVTVAHKGYLEVELPAHAKSGDVRLSVRKTTLLAGQFTVLERPLLYSVSHGYGKASLRLFLSGDGFDSGSYVVFEGALAFTQLTSSGSLLGTLYVDQPLAAGSYSVVACTPPHGCSAPLTLQVP